MKTRWHFKYAILHSKFGYYLGTARDEWEDNFSNKPNLDNPVYTFSRYGAGKKVASFQDAFRECKVVRYIA